VTLPPDVLKDLESFKAKLPKVVHKKRIRVMKDLKGTHPDEKPPFFSEIKPMLPKTENVRRNGKGSWLVMVPTGAAYRGLKSREDPIVKDSPITQAPYGVSHMTGVTARICNDVKLFKKSK
jgi:hypothetical protein